SEPPRHLLRVLGLDRDDLVHDRGIPERRDVADADAFDLVRAGLATQQDRGFRGLDGGDPYGGLVLLEDGCGSPNRGGGANAVHKGVDLPLRLTPDLLAQSAESVDAILVLELGGTV